MPITVKEFVFNALLTQQSLAQLAESGVTVQKPTDLAQAVTPVEQRYFSPRLMGEAEKMSEVYVAFFCLENAVRDLISQRLLERKGTDWWNESVPAKIKTAVETLKGKEAKNRYHTQRSTTLIGYTMFGNLAQIIIANWQEFSDLFPDQAWVTSRFNDLEMSRNVIMHTGLLPPIEIERIESIVRDWIRQAG